VEATNNRTIDDLITEKNEREWIEIEDILCLFGFWHYLVFAANHIHSHLHKNIWNVSFVEKSKESVSH
jgi:hypothetical protein